MATELRGQLTAEYYTLEYRPVPEGDPKSDAEPWDAVGTPVITTFRTPEEAIQAATPFNEEGLQCRVIIHRMISTELMRFF
jgi:hypothetical protein